MRYTRVTLATASSVLLLATLAACGSDPAPRATGPTTSQEGVAPGGGGQLPGASGKVAAVSGRTAQVQSDISGQVAVSWNDGTAFTQEVDASLSDVSVGSCVMVTGADGSDRTNVTAVSVRVLDDCTQPSTMPTDRPSDLPTDAPSNVPSGGPGGGQGGLGTIGEVSAVAGDGFTVSGMNDQDVAVTVTADTTYTTTAKASAAAVKVGACVTAQGETDDTGALTASTISVAKPVDGQCTGGFMLRGGPGAAQ